MVLLWRSWMAGSSPAMTPRAGQRRLIKVNPLCVAGASMAASTKEAVMRRPFLVPLSIAVILIVLMLGFEAASRPWGMMGPNNSWSGTWGDSWGDSWGHGPPMMHGTMMRGYGPPPWASWSSARDLNLTTDAVKTEAQRWVAWQGNPRLNVGDVKEKDADTITADIVTKDNSLVQRFSVNRHSGVVQDVED
jgi:hypothetical protein